MFHTMLLYKIIDMMVGIVSCASTARFEIPITSSFLALKKQVRNFNLRALKVIGQLVFRPTMMDLSQKCYMHCIKVMFSYTQLKNECTGVQNPHRCLHTRLPCV